ncbi:MAG TPA: ABC transporter substrate-binding protein [Thermoanaerobaculia bacterium]|nr:ABC transporter substrate-binding protein [Thermoanaerobaculia bacterium]
MSRATAAAVAACLVAVAACERPAPPVRIGIHSAPVDLDPHLQNESLTSAVLANVYEALTELDEETRVRPKVASGWTNPDERTWVFTLRQGARFHDGRAVTSADVVFSLERARRHPGSPLASYLVEVESVRALDEGRVEIRTRRPFAALLAKLTPVYIVPAGSPARITAPIGTGPYRLVRADGRRLDLVPAATAGDRPTAIGPLSFLVERDPARRLSALLAGEVDVAADLEEDAVATLASSDCCRAEFLPGSTIEYLHLSGREAPFRDPRVREAVHLSLDRPRYLAEARHGLGQPAGQLAVPGLFGYEPGLRAPERDLARARALLEAAGYAGGFDVVLEHRPGRRADVLARQLGEAGIRVVTRESTWTDLYRRLRRGEVGFYFGGVISPTGEASDVLDGYVHSREELRGYGASNHSRYSNRTADALIEAAGSSFSLVRRRELLQEAMRVVMADLHFVPVAGLYQVYGVRRDVEFRPRVDLKLLGDRIRRR